MAHFARLNDKNIVETVIVVNDNDVKDGNGDEVESVGIAFCEGLTGGGTWKQTSYNANHGHGKRGNYAGIGMTYLTNVTTLGVASTDIFIEQQPFDSWSIGVNTATWYSPVGECPTLTAAQEAANQFYYWNESAYQADTADPKTVGWALTTD